MAHPWKDLIVWQKSHELVLEIYKMTSNFPEKERFGLIQQIRRSSASVAALEKLAAEVSFLLNKLINSISK